MPPSSLLSDVLTAFTSLRRRPSLRESLRSFSSSSTGTSIKDKNKTRKASGSLYHPYSVYQQKMFPLILRDPDATRKLLEAILDSPNGKRTLSRLARTCRALSDPALNVLWRELDSLIPIIGLFPTPLLKRARKPGLGLTRMPLEEDWKKILKYGERVRRIAYEESANNVSASIFPIFDEYRPRTYILPRLLQLIWRAETPAGLDRCALFLSPELQSLTLEIGTRFPRLNAFLADMSSRTRLSTFSFISPTTLPDAFTELLLPQDSLEKLILVAPGALSPGVGRWIASLAQLKSLQLDLSGRSMIAVEGFFEELRPRSGDSTPTSVGSTDSGVFSGDEVDFSEIRKSALRLTGDLRSKGSFAQMRQLQLTGDVSNIAVFLKHLTSPLTQLDLVIEDPPDKADWQDLSTMICERFGASLQSLRITATGSSRFSDLVRSTSRAEPSSSRLSLEHLSSLSNLSRLEIDLPESIVFSSSDIVYLAKACPNIEVLRLCPVARFPMSTGPPKLTLDALAPLMSGCRRLHTLAVVVNAKRGSTEVLTARLTSSRSLLRLHVGHSWVNDPLQVTILLSHFAPYLENLKWFHEKNRPGFVEANARGWQKVSDSLLHLQNVRLAERQVTSYHEYKRPPTSDKGIDATVTTVDRGIHVRPRTVDSSVQFSPTLVSRMVEVKPNYISISIGATPHTVDASVHASASVTDQSVDARPPTELVLTEVHSTASKSVETAFQPPSDTAKSISHPYHRYLIFPSVFGLFSFACRLVISYPLSIPLRILSLLARFHWKGKERQDTGSERVPLDYSSTPDIGLENLQENLHEITQIGEISKNESKNPKYEPVKVIREVNEAAEVEVATWMRKRTPNPSNASQIDVNKHATRWQLGRKTYNSPYNSWNYTMSDNKKQERDFTPEVDAILPETTSLAQSGKLQEALDKLFGLEKQTRNASDLASTTRLVKAIIERCYEARDYTLLNSSVTLLSKKHGQLKGAVQAIVEQVMLWLDDVKKSDGVEKWLELIETLRGVTEGKIFLETPRARVTLYLSHYHEGLSNASTSTITSAKELLQTASDLLSDLQVETYSTMERREKTEFILEQMRLLIAVARQKDAEQGKDGKDSLGGGEAEWVKVRVGGRKVNEEFLKQKDNEDLKLKYYDLMIQHALHQSEYLDVAKYYYKVWETPSIKEDENDKGKAALEHIVYYVVLAPHNNEQSDMLHHLFVDPALAKLELHYNLVKCFTTRELMRWPGIETIYGQFLRKTPVFTADKRWEDLHTRVIEHNIRVVAQYYTRITLPRLTSLLDLTPQQTEEILARLVVSGTIWARVDRPAGIVNFRSKRSAEDVMNDWSSDMQKLLGLVEKTWMGMNAAQAAQSRVKV